MIDQDLLNTLQKALDTSATNGNAYLDPVLLSQIITEQVRRTPLLRNYIPREPFRGLTYLYDSVVADGDAYTAADGANLTPVDATFSQGSAKLSYYYAPAIVTNPAIVASQELVDVVKMRMGQAVKSVMRREGRAIYNGDSNNNTWNGLTGALAGTANDFSGASATQLSDNLMGEMDVALKSQGYDQNLLWVLPPKMFAAVQSAAYQRFRATLNDGPVATFGYPLNNTGLTFHGVPAIPDVYAQNYVSVSSESLTGSGAVYSFANRYPVTQIPVGGTDDAGTSLTLPVVKVSGNVVNNYSIVVNPDGGSVITFTGSPSATPTANYYYAQQNAYLLSLNKEDIIMPVSKEIAVEQIASVLASDDVRFRVKLYSALVVRNTFAHSICKNVYAPSNSQNFG